MCCVRIESLHPRGALSKATLARLYTLMTMTNHRDNNQNDKVESNDKAQLSDDDIDADQQHGLIKSCSTTLSTASETSEGSFLPSFSHDSDTASRSEEELRQVSFTPTTSDVLRHRRDPSVSLFTPSSLLHYSPPDDSHHSDDLSRCAKVKLGRPACLATAFSQYRLGMLRLIVIASLSFALVCRCLLTHVAVGTNPQFKWRIPASSRQVRRMARRIEQHDQYQPTFTILLKASRMDLLQASLDRHAYCKSVESIRISWSGENAEELPDSLLQHASGKVREAAAGANEELTNAVFLLDEGLQFDCRELSRAYQEWQRDPIRVVGLLASSDGQVSLVSESAVFVHKLLLAARPRPAMSNDPCTEFVMSAFLAKAMSRPTVPMISQPKRLVSSRATIQQESQCVSILAKSFGLKQSRAMQVHQQYVGQK